MITGMEGALPQKGPRYGGSRLDNPLPFSETLMSENENVTAALATGGHPFPSTATGPGRRGAARLLGRTR